MAASFSQLGGTDFGIHTADGVETALASAQTLNGLETNGKPPFWRLFWGWRRFLPARWYPTGKMAPTNLLHLVFGRPKPPHNRLFRRLSLNINDLFVA